MDKSQEYILMCEKAKEIQHQYFKTDKICHNEKNYYERGFPFPDDKSYNLIWLPRQDQLQEMINEVNYHKVWNFYEFVMDDIGSESKKSMEQLWLAYVMRHKYNKIWSEKDWIKKERKWKNK